MPVTPATEVPFSASTTSNWIAKHGGLPPRVRGIARAIMQRRPGTSESDAIALAVHLVKTTAATGRVFGGKQQAKPATIAAHTTATAQWEALKARAKAQKATHLAAVGDGVVISLADTTTPTVGSASDGPRVTVSAGLRRLPPQMQARAKAKIRARLRKQAK